MPTAPTLGGEGTWSDRDIAEGRKLTAIGVKKIQLSGRWIAKIRARWKCWTCNIFSLRYNDVWSDWRRTNYYDAGREEETLVLATGENITSISGCSDDSSTISLQAETSAGRQWGPFGNHSGQYGSLLSSPPTSSGLRLHHLSGDQNMHSRIIRLLQL